MSPSLTSCSFFADAVWIMVLPFTSQEPVVTSIQDNTGLTVVYLISLLWMVLHYLHCFAATDKRW